MIVKLTQNEAKDPSLSGGKGSQLAELIAQGLPVPGGFVIGTEAFDEFCQTYKILEKLETLLSNEKSKGSVQFYKDIENFQSEIRQYTLPEHLLNEVSAQLSESEPASLWAVRSSAVAEDMEGASFAGQYDTVLGVSGIEEISKAILHCWASFFNSNAIQYKRDRNIVDNRAAVVVQQLINADAAGVCFSINPLNGCENEVVINANYGLGESVVGGLATPDTFIVDKAENKILSAETGSKKVKTVRIAGGSKEIETTQEEQSAQCLSSEQVKQVTELVIKVETIDKHSVDIEWALAGEGVYLLQSRPVTASAQASKGTEDSVISEPPEAWVPEYGTTIDPKYPLYTNGNVSEILPGCITPLTWSRIAPTIDYSFTQQLYQLKMLDKKPEPLNELKTLGFFYYRPYLRISFFTETAIAAPGISPDFYLEEFIGKPEKATPGFDKDALTPGGILHFSKICVAGVSNLLKTGERIHACEDYMKALLADSSADKIKARDNKTLIDSVAFNEAYGELSVVHIWVSTFAGLGFSIIRKLTNRWFDDEGGTLAASLITGIGVMPSAEPAFEMHDLAQIILKDSVLFAFFEQSNDKEVYQSLANSDHSSAQAFIKSLNKFLGTHGHRGICENELMTKCWRDDPAQVVGMIRNFLMPNAIAPKEVQKQQEKASRESTQACLGQLNVFQGLLFKPLLAFVRRYVLKREELKNFITLREDRARCIFQELARRFTDAGDIKALEDIYFLTWAEIYKLVNGKLSGERAREILAKRQQEFEWCKQLQMPKLINGEAKPISLESMAGHKRLVGMGVYPGKVEGKARVVMDPRTENKVEPGEILVAPVTDAGWTPLFINAAALVVEVGGLLSHGSVVAREYGLPAVVGAEGATQMIKTGDNIVVDGKTGMVALLD